jgi:transposase-like protein
MARIPRSEQFRQEWQEILSYGVAGENEGLLDALVRTGAQYMLQVAIEEEVTEFLGREHYQRGERIRQGLRNGYEPKRLITGQGVIEIGVPQVRDTDEPFHSEILAAITNRSETLEELIRRMYVRGLSQQDVADAFAEAFDERVMSKSTVSRVAKTLQEEFDNWRKRDLSKDPVIYLFLDAVYLPARQGDRGKDAVLCAYGITEWGRKVLLHLDMGEKESYAAWLGFLYNLVDRGVTSPVLVASDGSPGLRKAVREVYPRAIRQRCKVHKTRNILAKTPKSAQKFLGNEIKKIFAAQDQKEAMRLAQTVIERYRDEYPSAIACLEEDLKECLAHLILPPAHHKATGTTNLIERLFGEGRRRTKVVGRFPNEGSCLRLVFATLMAASKSWRGVRMTPAMLKELRQLKNNLYGEESETAVSANAEDGSREAGGELAQAL